MRNHVPRLSLYADDVVLFTTTNAVDLLLVRGILQKFRAASGQHTNLSKSSILLIRCDEGLAQQARDSLRYGLAEFPCKYLGLPLTIRRLTKTDLQPYIDRIADMLPGRKAALMATSGRLILVKAGLMAIPIHLLIALDLPK